MFRSFSYWIFVATLHTTILAFDCVSSCSPELSGLRSGESSSCTEMFLISRIRREGYLSGLRDGWEQLWTKSFRHSCKMLWGNRLKRAYTRACARAMREGYAIFKGIPFRIKQHILANTPQPRVIKPEPTPPKLGFCQFRIFQWNASRTIEYHLWLQWCDDNPYDIIVV